MIDSFQQRLSAPIVNREKVPTPIVWQAKDWLAVGALGLIGLVLLVVRLNSPPGLVFDEHWYARDGCWYVLSSRDQCGLAREVLVDKDVATWLRVYNEVSPEQPPLGKRLIGAGIWLFGFGGWPARLASVGCGAATIALLYVLAWRLFKSRIAAIVAAGLLTVDFLHFVQARLAMLDVFVSFFGVAAYVFCVLDRDQILERRNKRAAGSYWSNRKWRVAAGLAAGAAAASKLSGWFVVLGIFLLVSNWEVQSRQVGDLWRALLHTVREEGRSVGFALICVPVLVYAASYAGRLEGTIFIWPWASDSWFRALIDRQFHMVEYHSTAVGARVNPATLFLPTLAKPMLYSVERSGDVVRAVLVFGNPLVWWPAIAALLVLLARWIGARKLDQPEGTVLSGFVLNYAVWLLMTWARPQVMLHYLTPLLPFICLLVGYLVAVTSPRLRRIVGVSILGIAGLVFALFYPALTAVPISSQGVDGYINVADVMTGHW